MNRVDFRPLSAAIVYEAAVKLGDMEPSIRSIISGLPLRGYAFTAKCLVGDSRAALRAIEHAQPGDVLVIDAGGTDRATVWGGRSTIAAKARMLAGLVTNGAVRDVDQIASLGFPIFAHGISVRGTMRTHDGWLQIPVSVGGVVVQPGDYIVADSDGVVVVPSARVGEVMALATSRDAQEREKERQAAEGGRLF